MRLADPSQMERGPRRFVAYWLRDLALDFDRRGWPAFIPLTFLSSALIGTTVAIFAKDALWHELQNAIAFYAAGLAVNAILLAVCWAGFARIFESLGDPEFGPWMKQRGFTGLYGFYVDFIQLTQMAAVAAMGCGLLLSMLDQIPNLAQRLALGVAVACSIYAARWTAGCVQVMQDISDHRATFKESMATVASLKPAAASNGN